MCASNSLSDFHPCRASIYPRPFQIVLFTNCFIFGIQKNVVCHKECEGTAIYCELVSPIYLRIKKHDTMRSDYSAYLENMLETHLCDKTGRVPLKIRRHLLCRLMNLSVLTWSTRFGNEALVTGIKEERPRCPPLGHSLFDCAPK